MHPTEVIKLYMPYAPDGFDPVYALETEPGATSIILSAWIRSGDGWSKIDTCSDDWATDVHDAPKVKYFHTSTGIEVYANDKRAGFFDHKSLPNKAVNRTP